MLRRWVACLCAVVILFSMVGVAEEKGDYHIEPILLAVFDLTAAEWYESVESRTFFATAVWMDIVLSENETLGTAAKNAVENDRVYVAKDGLRLYVFFWYEEGCVIIEYTHLTEEFYAHIVPAMEVTDAMITSLMKEFEKSGLFSSYYQIDKEYIYTALEVFLDNLEDYLS